MDGKDFINHVQIKDLGDQTSAHSLNPMGPLIVSSDSSFGFGDQHLLTWLYSYHFKIRFERGDTIFLAALDVLANTRNSAPSSNTGHKDVDLAVGVSPNLRPCGLSVDLGVGFVLKLLQHEPIAIQSINDFLGLRQRSRHGSLLGREDDLTSQRQQHHAPFHTHGLGHGQDAPVTTFTSNEGKSNPGVTTRGLDQNRLPRRDQSLGLGIVDHRPTKTILDAGARTKRLELADETSSIRHINAVIFQDLVQINQRCVADKIRGTACDVERSGVGQESRSSCGLIDLARDGRRQQTTADDAGGGSEAHGQAIADDADGGGFGFDMIDD